MVRAVSPPPSAAKAIAASPAADRSSGQGPAPGVEPARDDEAAVAEARLVLNLRRVQPTAAIMLPVAAAIYLAFPAGGEGLAPDRALWRQVLHLSHAGLLLSLLPLAIGAWLVARTSVARRPWHVVLPVVMSLYGVLAGAWFAGVDQLVTSAITPYLACAFGMATLFRLTAGQAALVQGAGLAAVVAAVAAYQPQADARASAQVNALTVAGLGFALSVVLVRAHDRAERARLLIARQGAELTQLRGLLRVCAYCKKIKDERRGWEPLEAYVARHSEARFSHGMCEACYTEHIGEPPPGGQA